MTTTEEKRHAEAREPEEEPREDAPGEEIPHEQSGDMRVWKFEYEKALGYVDSGNVADARRILQRLAEEAPFEEIRQKAKRKGAQFRPDWLAYAFFGGSLLTLIIIIAVYYF